MNLALTSRTSCPGATNGSLQVNVTGGLVLIAIIIIKMYHLVEMTLL